MQAAVVHLARQPPGLSLCTIPGTCSEQGVRFTEVSVGNNLRPALARTVWIISGCLEKLHCFTALLSRWRCLPGFRLRFGQARSHTDRSETQLEITRIGGCVLFIQVQGALIMSGGLRGQAGINQHIPK